MSPERATPGVAYIVPMSIDAHDAERLMRIARQDARTCSYLGVNFVPLGPITQTPEQWTAPEPSLQAHRVEARPESALPHTHRADAHDPPIVRTRSVEPTRSVAPVPRAPVPKASEAARPMSVPALPVPILRAGDDHAGRRAALDALRARYELDAPHRHFVTAHTCIVFDDGDPCAQLMFIGEAPGADEDREGIPFVGKAGQLLNKMIDAMGLSRDRVYIANVLKTRPPGNATPTSEEARACAPYLYGQIAIVRPRVIVTLGLPATRLILDSTDAMGRLRGSWRSFVVPEGIDPGIIPPDAVGSEIAVMPTYHPAFLLRSYTRENREKVWSDLQQVMNRLGLSPAPKS